MDQLPMELPQLMLTAGDGEHSSFHQQYNRTRRKTNGRISVEYCAIKRDLPACIILLGLINKDTAGAIEAECWDDSKGKRPHTTVQNLRQRKN